MSSTSPNADSEHGRFWRFSLELYGRRGVASACVDLQDRHGRDVNLVLFAAWVGFSGRGRLSDADFARAEDAVGSWRRAVIEPLRAVRRQLKESGPIALYDAVKAAELDAEHTAQDRLEPLAPAQASPTTARLEDALANLARYLGATGVPAPLRDALIAITD